MSQFASEPQLVGQLPELPLHTYTPQSGLPANPADFSVHEPATTLHASHPPLHAELQQTPSTQYPETHSDAELQAVPLAFPDWHRPPMQDVLFVHWEEPVQVVGQLAAVPLHR